MPSYVDGFVLPVPKEKVDAYRRMARKAGDAAFLTREFA